MRSESISNDTVAQAERLLGISYTDTERALIAETIGAQIDLAVARRALTFPETLAPAGRFDPRLPGWIPPPERDVRPWQPTSRSLPTETEDIAFASIADLGVWLRGGELSSVALTEIYLDRIQRLGPALFCIATVTEERAFIEARRADRLFAEGIDLGPLQGIPWAAKDLLDTAGIRTAWGAEPYRDRVPQSDSAVVAKLTAAGAVLIAKTAVGALAYGDVWYGGKCRNPWNLDEGSSGSSAGSASALAAGLMAFTIGTETAGSIIAPAMRCGNTALRPTFGRVSRVGAMPLAWSLDKIGPMCRTVEDTALVFAAIDGFDAHDPGSIAAPFGYDATASISGRRVGYFPADFEDPDAVPLDRTALDTARAVGLELIPLERPDLPYQSLRSVLFAEGAAAFEALTLTGRDEELGRQDADAWPNEFRKARFLSAVDYVQLDRFRRQVMQLFDGYFQNVDAIIGPSLVGPMLLVTNFTGHPSVVLRSGFIETPSRTKGLSVAEIDRHGPMHTVPHGISLWGRLFDEGTLIEIGMALERQFGIVDRRPASPPTPQTRAQP